MVGAATLGTTIVARIGVNANGGVARMVYPPGMEIDCAPSTQLSFRSISGTGNITLNVIVEEVG